MNFGKNLLILRKMTNMTQEELAEKMNVSRQTTALKGGFMLIPNNSAKTSSLFCFRNSFSF